MSHPWLRSLFASLFLAGPGFADTAPDLDDVSAYFNRTPTLETRFTQHNADGSRSTGTLYLERPGKLRMEYDPDTGGGLLLVSGGSVAIFDDRGDSRPHRYALNQTPLAPLLARHVDLARAEEVSGQDAGADFISVLARDPDHPGRGQARFTLKGAPLELASWIMTNQAGETTHISFEDELHKNHYLPHRLFSIRQEIENRTPQRGR
jgi:outer membrane lipoprotein-sorting protein